MDACIPNGLAAPRASTAVGWRLDEGERAALLERFAPAYPDVVAHHVTLAMNVDPDEPLPPPCSGRIIGEADDGAGVQCLVVELGGSCERPDGGVFHITWSLDRARGRQPLESNHVIAWLGWRRVGPAPLRLIPGRF